MAFRQMVKLPCILLMAITNIEMKAVIIGAGTYGEVYLSYLSEAGYEIVGFLDDDVEKQQQLFKGKPVLGGVNLLTTLKASHGVEAVFCPLGNNILRVNFLKKAKELGFLTPNFIHPSVFISPDVTIGNEGIYILPRTVIMPWVTIENYVMMSVNSIVSHHSTLKQGVFLSFGVNFGASIIADEYAYFGISSTAMTGVKRIGKNSMIGAGAVVIKDVPENAVVAGVPAKVLKYKSEIGGGKALCYNKLYNHNKFDDYAIA